MKRYCPSWATFTGCEQFAQRGEKALTPGLGKLILREGASHYVLEKETDSCLVYIGYAHCRWRRNADGVYRCHVRRVLCKADWFPGSVTEGRDGFCRALCYQSRWIGLWQWNRLHYGCWEGGEMPKYSIGRTAGQLFLCSDEHFVWPPINPAAVRGFSSWCPLPRLRAVPALRIQHGLSVGNPACRGRKPQLTPSANSFECLGKAL
jgi:hypothetical protein